MGFRNLWVRDNLKAGGAWDDVREGARLVFGVRVAVAILVLSLCALLTPRAANSEEGVSVLYAG